jgi:hypothetical protein
LLFGGLIGIMLGPMDQKIMARALERAEQHVIDGERLIAQQKELIANLSAAETGRKRVLPHARPA